jgi:hypothetical protein
MVKLRHSIWVDRKGRIGEEPGICPRVSVNLRKNAGVELCWTLFRATVVLRTRTVALGQLGEMRILGDRHQKRQGERYRWLGTKIVRADSAGQLLDNNDRPDSIVRIQSILCT